MNAIKPYLRLVYLPATDTSSVWIGNQGRTNRHRSLALRASSIYTDALPLAGQLMPEMTGAWKEATSMRQLNWLWQWATLQPLSSEDCVNLAPQLLQWKGR